MPTHDGIVATAFMFIKKIRTQKTIKDYVSDIDKRLAEFDRTHSSSASQQAEIKKYLRVFELRDIPTAQIKKPSLWDF